METTEYRLEFFVRKRFK